MEKVDKNVNLEIVVAECVSVNGGFIPPNPDIMDDMGEVRMRQAGYLYFVLRRDGREIAKELGISKSLVYEELNEYKRRYIRKIKSDLKKYKIIFGHMVELLAQSDFRIKETGKKMASLEEQIAVLRQRMNKARALSGKAKIMKMILGLEDRQLSCLTHLRMETLVKLQIFVRFGLCDIDIAERLAGKDIDTASATERVRAFTIALIEIVKKEVPDVQTRKNIFGQLAMAVKLKAIKDESPDSEF